MAKQLMDTENVVKKLQAELGFDVKNFNEIEERLRARVKNSEEYDEGAEFLGESHHEAPLSSLPVS